MAFGVFVKVSLRCQTPSRFGEARLTRGLRSLPALQTNNFPKRHRQPRAGLGTDTGGNHGSCPQPGDTLAFSSKPPASSTTHTGSQLGICLVAGEATHPHAAAEEPQHQQNRSARCGQRARGQCVPAEHHHQPRAQQSDAFPFSTYTRLGWSPGKSSIYMPAAATAGSPTLPAAPRCPHTSLVLLTPPLTRALEEAVHNQPRAEARAQGAENAWQ